MHHDGAGRRASRHANALAVFEGADGGGGEAVGDVASHQLGGFGGTAVHDQGDKLGVLLKVPGAGFVTGREFEAEAPVAIGFVPQVVQETDEYVVVRGPVKRLVEGAV